MRVALSYRPHRRERCGRGSLLVRLPAADSQPADTGKGQAGNEKVAKSDL